MQPRERQHQQQQQPLPVQQTHIYRLNSQQQSYQVPCKPDAAADDAGVEEATPEPPMGDPAAMQQQQMQMFAAMSASIAASLQATAWGDAVPNLAELTRQALAD